MSILYKIIFSFFVVSFTLVGSCIAQNGELSVEQDAQIPQLLDKRVAMSKNNVLGERYKIQLYYGNNGEASRVISRFRSLYGDWPSEVVYETPNYKVWVGNFRNKLEADRALLRIKPSFTSAFIFKPDQG